MAGVSTTAPFSFAWDNVLLGTYQLTAIATDNNGALGTSAPVSLTSAGVAKLRQPPTPADPGGLIGVQSNALDLRPTDAAWRGGRLELVGSCVRGFLKGTLRVPGRGAFAIDHGYVGTGWDQFDVIVPDQSDAGVAYANDE